MTKISLDQLVLQTAISARRLLNEEAVGSERRQETYELLKGLSEYATNTNAQCALFVYKMVGTYEASCRRDSAVQLELPLGK